MSVLKSGICPCCFKARELAFFQFGCVKVTMCVYCIKRYLDSSVIPNLNYNNDTSTDSTLSDNNLSDRSVLIE